MAASHANSTELYQPNAFSAGPCNYRELGSGQSCGCRRLWIKGGRDGLRLIEDSERAWCFCGHHACYHDMRLLQNDDVEVRTPTTTMAQAIQDNSSHVHQHPVRDIRRAGAISNSSNAHNSSQRTIKVPGLGLDIAGRRHGIWDTLNDYARNQAGSASDNGSTLPSTAEPSLCHGQIRGMPYLPSSMPAIAHAVGNEAVGANVHQQQEPGSATEINTPSMAGTPTMRPPRPRPSHLDGVRYTTSPILLGAEPPSRINSPLWRPFPASAPVIRHTSDGIDGIWQHVSRLSAPNLDQLKVPAAADPSPSETVLPASRELHNLLRTCLQRIEVLESLSATHVPLEEIEDKFENLDARLLDLEAWRVDSEAQQPQNSSEDSQIHKRRRSTSPDLAKSFGSSSPVSSHATSRSSSSQLSATAAVYAQYSSRFSNIESRLDTMELSVPSYAHPWHIEVVLLPWGRELRGIWMTPQEDLDRSQTAVYRDSEWNGIESSRRSFMSDEIVSKEGWTTDSIMAWADAAVDWLCPKACGPEGVVYKRLASRGLVKKITISSADAHNLLETCSTAFGEFLTRQHSAWKGRTAFDGNWYEALNEPIVPLRKRKRSSRLRFLSTNEVITSACWNATFLDSSVIMKARGGSKRLYLTTPEAYHQTNLKGWTWQDLRQLPPHEGIDQDDDSTLLSENCWAHHPSLDGLPDVSSSFASRSGLPKRPMSIRSEDFGEDVSSDNVVSDNQGLSDDISYRLTSSLPAPMHEGPSRTKSRRMASLETSVVGHKRRRTSSSTGIVRNGAMFTPRLSREPPSPFLSDNQGESRSQNESSRKRGHTPFAYATPHSNTANTAATMYVAGQDGDTEADTDIMDRSPQFEAQWEQMPGVYGQTPGMYSSSPANHRDNCTDLRKGDSNMYD